MSALDTVIRKLEGELDERKSAYEAILSHAEQEGREPNESETATMSELTVRMRQIGDQLKGYDETDKVIGDFAVRARELDSSIQTRRDAPNGVQYRSAGEYALDAYKSALGDQAAKSRMEVFYRAAAHQKTADNLGVIPDPVIGDVIDFIDASRPLVAAIGPQNLPSATWHRPVVTQHTSVDPQGAAGAAADEKAELVSQKMTITRLTANAVTYGGYVNVSRQNIDLSNGQVMDIIIRDLAAQYAIQTEAAVGVELTASTTAAMGMMMSMTCPLEKSMFWRDTLT